MTEGYLSGSTPADDVQPPAAALRPAACVEEPQNEYGRGFMQGHRAGYSTGRASRAAEIEQYRRRIHELDQENHQLRRLIGHTETVENTHTTDLRDDLHRAQNAAVPAVRLPRDLAL